MDNLVYANNWRTAGGHVVRIPSNAGGTSRSFGPVALFLALCVLGLVGSFIGSW
jgi:hypothetical protein